MTDTAVLVIDTLNSYERADSCQLTGNILRIIEPLADLIQRARESDDVDLAYVNDNYGDFTAEFSDIVRSACGGARPDLVDPIVPTMGSRPNRSHADRVSAKIAAGNSGHQGK